MHFLASRGTTDGLFAAVAVPKMTELTRKGQPHRVHWTPRQGVAFQKLKDSPIQGPVLRVADPSKPYILQKDVMYYGMLLSMRSFVF